VVQRRAVAPRQIIEHDNSLARCPQPFDRHAANVTSASGYKDCHEFPRFSIPSETSSKIRRLKKVCRPCIALGVYLKIIKRLARFCADSKLPTRQSSPMATARRARTRKKPMDSGTPAARRSRTRE